jgi:tRNA A22 N-methylase
MILSDGFDNVNDNFDTAILAGMGGILITNILSKGLDKIKGAKLIIEPNSDASLVRDFLAKNNYKITYENAIYDANKYYEIIVAEEGNEYYVHCVRTSGADSTDELTASKEIKAVRYYNAMGQQMSEPNGITIVVTEYTDGTTDTKKVLR